MNSPNQNNNSTLVLVMIVVVAIVAGWMLLISPARSGQSDAQDAFNAAQKKLHPPAPKVSADDATSSSAGVALHPLSSSELQKEIQSAAGKVRVVKLKPDGSGYDIEVAGTMPAITSFFKHLSTVQINPDAYITASGPLIKISDLSISNSPASGTVASAVLSPYQ